jgi:hypothetical protein
MNYIELINQFWTCDEVASFKPTETRLYFYLLKVANSLGWNETFWHSDSKTAANAGFTVNTLKSSRLRLKQFNLIEFNSGGKGQGDKTRYQILTPKLTPKLTAKVEPKVEPKVQPKVTPKVENSLYNEINKTKLNKPQTPSRDLPTKPKLDFIDELVKAFQSKFYEIRKIEYFITNKGKERSAAAKILSFYKAKHPISNTYDTLAELTNYFECCIMQTQDDWLHKNMSLSMIVSKFNEINQILKNGTTSRTTAKSPATTDAQRIANIAAGLARAAGN